MRADRLVEILLLLQARGQVTAAEVADELEISERTARRDLEALGMAGLPIYSVRGRKGGWRLLGDGRTDLTGLSAPEARALFLVAGPQTANPEVRSALRKLVEALPETFREEAQVASDSIVVDPVPWGKAPYNLEDPQFLDQVQTAVVTGAEAELGYVNAAGDETNRIIVPLGLAKKGNRWYFLASTERGNRLFRIDRVRSWQPTGTRHQRPPDFDLHEAWESVVADFGTYSTPILTTGRVREGMIRVAFHVFGARVTFPSGVPEWIGPHWGEGGDDMDMGGWAEFELRGYNLASLVGECAGFGDLLQLDGPPELLAGLADLGQRLLDQYGRDGDARRSDPAR